MIDYSIEVEARVWMTGTQRFLFKGSADDEESARKYVDALIEAGPGAMMLNCYDYDIDDKEIEAELSPFEITCVDVRESS